MACQTGPVTPADTAARSALLRRGFALEYVTLAWKVAGIVVLAIAAISARSVALAGFGLDSLIEIGASTVVIWELSGTGEERQWLGRPGLMACSSAAGQAAALLARDPAAHAALDNPGGVADLLDWLREAGAHQQAAALTDRLPTAGMFGLFPEQKGLADQSRFGQEADGTPAAPWGWEDLDLWLVPQPRGP
jgi:hypothetical protein